jgi:hypothetical protein
MRKKTNKILKDNGNWLLVDISTPKFPNTSMKVDTDDWQRFTGTEGFGKVGASHQKKSDSTLYARFASGYGRKNSKSNKFHRFVLSGVDCVDHVNRDGLDNRKSNLRDGSNGVNAFNQKVRSDNTTGFRGVKLRGDTGRYSACIKINGKVHHLGCFDTAEGANEAYQSFYRKNTTQL